MGKKLIGIAVIAIMLFGVFGLIGCSSPYDPYEDRKNPVVESECGNFFVQLYNEYKNGVQKGEAVVLELTEAGKGKEVLVIPSQVDGKPVTQIGLSVTRGSYHRNWGIGNFDGASPKKIYVPYTVINIPTLKYSIMASGEAIICDEIIFLSKDAPVNFAVKATTLVGLFLGEGIPLTLDFETAPNLIYRYNYQNAINAGCFWIDYITGDNLSFDPIQPTRDGYTFTGWFLETECINQWDGAKPSSKNENLNLFAGWNKD